ncbi:MAG: hypothetical protein JKY92_00135 [Magnetovibrio sp.]|nr:hypothetical protein [Magnetovibrio sp.]
MKINVRKVQPKMYCVTLGGVSHTLNTDQLKTMVLETVRALSPDVFPDEPSYSQIQVLSERLTLATSAQLQKFILHANDDDLLVFLKCTQMDEALHQKLFDNMSQRKHTMLSEDIQYGFHDGLTDDQRHTAILKLSNLAGAQNL